MVPEIEKQIKYRSYSYRADQNDTLVAAHINIAHLKRFNDTYGHLTGDLVLQELGKRISGAFKHDAVIGRVDGDKILILFHRNGETTDNVEDSIKKALHQKAPLPFTQDGSLKKLGINVSVQENYAPHTAQILDLTAKRRANHTQQPRPLAA